MYVDVRMYVMYVCIVCMYVMYCDVMQCIYMYVCKYVCMYVYACIYVCIYVYMYVCICVYKYVCIYVCMCICIYIRYVFVFLLSLLRISTWNLNPPPFDVFYLSPLVAHLVSPQQSGLKDHQRPTIIADLKCSIIVLRYSKFYRKLQFFLWWHLDLSKCSYLQDSQIKSPHWVPP